MELALRARRGHRVCRLLIELRPRPAGLQQSVQPSQSSQMAECVGAPAQTRERALRAPSRDWLAWWSLTRRPEPARPLRCAHRFAGYADAALRSRHASVARQPEAPLREHGDDAGLAPLAECLAASASSRACDSTRRRARPPRPERNGGRLPGLAHEAGAPATLLVPARLGLRLAHAPARADCRRGTEPDSVRFSSLHSVAQPPRPRCSPAGSPLHCVPFRCLKPAETGQANMMLTALARCRVSC